jgi:hypothetical protein
MNPNKTIIPTLALLVLTVWPAAAERIVVPVADPTQPVTLEASVPNADITVEAWDGNEVIVEYDAAPESAGEIEEVDGRYRIPNSSSRFSAEAEGNVVEISSGWAQGGVRLRLQVPVRTNLEINSVHSDGIRVFGVEGHHELRAVNGPVEATDIAGSLVAGGQNGPVTVSFRRLDDSRPSSFVSWNGTITVTLPADAGADVRVQAMNGEILSDFPVEMQPTETETETEDGQFSYRHSRNVRFLINGGGPELQFKSFNGDVELRAAGAE